MIAVMLFSESWSEVFHAQLSDYKTAGSIWGRSSVTTPIPRPSPRLPLITSTQYLPGSRIIIAEVSCAFPWALQPASRSRRIILVLWLQLWTSHVKLFFLPARNWYGVFSFPSCWDWVVWKTWAKNTAVDQTGFIALCLTIFCPVHRVSGFWFM